MSLIELVTMIGSVTGATLGLSLYGIIGLILGIPIGFLGAFYLTFETLKP
jgi:hypothetical protein